VKGKKLQGETGCVGKKGKRGGGEEDSLRRAESYSSGGEESRSSLFLIGKGERKGNSHSSDLPILSGGGKGGAIAKRRGEELDSASWQVEKKRRTYRIDKGEGGKGCHPGVRFCKKGELKLGGWFLYRRKGKRRNFFWGKKKKKGEKLLRFLSTYLLTNRGWEAVEPGLYYLGTNISSTRRGKCV